MTEGNGKFVVAAILFTTAIEIVTGELAREEFEALRDKGARTLQGEDRCMEVSDVCPGLSLRLMYDDITDEFWLNPGYYAEGEVFYQIQEKVKEAFDIADHLQFRRSGIPDD